MIFNPVVSGEGTERYTITTTNNDSFPSSAPPGEFVVGRVGGKFGSCTIQTEDGESVPWDQGYLPGNWTTVTFVMPSKNVIVEVN